MRWTSPSQTGATNLKIDVLKRVNVVSSHRTLRDEIRISEKINELPDKTKDLTA